MARPRKEDARDTRRLVLDAALDLFSTHGYYATSMRQIARAVGVRESALYHHFASKDAILAALLDTLGPGQARELLTLDIPAMAKKWGARKLLRTLMHRLLEAWATPQEHKIAKLMLAEGPRLSVDGVFSPVTRIFQAREMLGHLFTELIRLKLIRPVDPQAATIAFIGPLFMLRMIYLVMSPVPQLPKLKKEADAHFTLLWETLKKT
ncbi:MAG: TetR/AcrR family transcriptional regulator [Myxococcaceae bacterium]|nr:TetR/AcrR family transcriptional regulator [Myxococcaceae bacterium]